MLIGLAVQPIHFRFGCHGDRIIVKLSNPAAVKNKMNEVFKILLGTNGRLKINKWHFSKIQI